MPPALEILLNPGEILYNEGDANDCAYIVESGEIVLYSTLLGKRIDCEKRGAGSIVGELSILTGQPRAVTVEAVTECRLFKVEAEQIVGRFEQLDPVLRACIETSIKFAATFTEQVHTKSDEVPVAPTTLRNVDKLIDQFRFEKDILTGLQRGEFSLVYQPIVALSDERAVGVEALMRWQHPTVGNIPPFRFIQVAEAMGSIGLLTEFAISETCSALTRMKAAASDTKDLYAAVNISGKDIGREGFVDFIANVLDRNSLAPESLKLEITETALVDDPETASKHLNALRTLGCGISIDDFGTGYSNLAYLKTLPLTTLKIDRAFAGDAHSNAVSRSIVRMLITLGSELGADVVAEGLETLDDVETLRALGCEFAQGYHFCRPAPEAEIIERIASEDGRGVCAA